MPYSLIPGTPWWVTGILIFFGLFGIFLAILALGSVFILVFQRLGEFWSVVLLLFGLSLLFAFMLHAGGSI